MNTTIPDDADADLSDAFWKTSDSELDAILARVREGKASPDESEWFTVYVMARFCRQLYRGEPIDTWVLSYFADAFAKVASGGLWHDELPLPWMPMTEFWSPIDAAALQLYCDVENAKIKKPNKLLGVIIEETATAHHVSLHKAKADYYKWRQKILKSEGDK